MAKFSRKAAGTADVSPNDQSAGLKTNSPSSGKTEHKSAKKPRSHEIRETIESVIVAFVLAFLFRTFEAEAFVIPTGSMAPTLRGRHKEADCPQCKTHIVVGASVEVDENGYLYGRMIGNDFQATRRVDTAICPNCRFPLPIHDLPAFKGDRILVNKFPPEFGNPERWDVIVFKYPEHPMTNYIKRLVGLPGEQIRIQQGDVYVNEAEGGPIRILRKSDPDKQLSLQMLVYDNDHPERKLHELGWPERWAAVQTGNGPQAIADWTQDTTGWNFDADTRTFTLPSDRATDGELRWVRYRHFVPRPEDWELVEQAAKGQPVQLVWEAPDEDADRFGEPERPSGTVNLRERLQLIADFCGYNAYSLVGRGGYDEDAHYWVGDLTLSTRVQVEDVGEQAEVVFELIEGRRKYRCRIDLASGTATLLYPDDKSRSDADAVVLGTAPTDMQGTGTWDVAFANVDDRLCLWIDGDLVDFGRAESGELVGVYAPIGGTRARTVPTEADLSPVGIAARGASVQVSQLLLERDIYYRAEQFAPHSNRQSEYFGDVTALDRLLSSPTAWFERYRAHSEEATEFERLGPDEFFAMGDNSPQSKDSRLWPPDREWHEPGESPEYSRHAVPRSALVGKAFFVYWPHGVPFLNGGKGFGIRNHTGAQDNGSGVPAGPILGKTDYPSFHFPFYPDFSRMRRIR